MFQSLCKFLKNLKKFFQSKGIWNAIFCGENNYPLPSQALTWALFGKGSFPPVFCCSTLMYILYVRWFIKARDEREMLKSAVKNLWCLLETKGWEPLMEPMHSFSCRLSAVLERSPLQPSWLPGDLSQEDWSGQGVGWRAGAPASHSRQVCSLPRSCGPERRSWPEPRSSRSPRRRCSGGGSSSSRSGRSTCWSGSWTFWYSS